MISIKETVKTRKILNDIRWFCSKAKTDRAVLTLNYFYALLDELREDGRRINTKKYRDGFFWNGIYITHVGVREPANHEV